MIELKQIKKSYKSHQVLENVDLVVERGELILIQGTNGCGKSTLLKIIASIEKQDFGEVILNSKNVGALIENPHFIEKETIYFNLEFLYNLKSKFEEKKVLELCNYLGLDLYEKTAIKKYSLGMRQKVGILQAIMENQDIILLDEPLRGLDAESTKKFTELLANLVTKQKTIIICAHGDLGEIEFSNRYELRNGILYKV